MVMEKNNCTQVQINYEIFCKTKRTFLSEPFSELPEPFLNRANYGRHKKSVLRALVIPELRLRSVCHDDDD